MDRLKSGERSSIWKPSGCERRIRVSTCLSRSPQSRIPYGEVVGASKVARDISESKRAREAVERSEGHLNDFFENSAIGLHWVGPDGTILRVNQAELDLLGYTRGEYVGHHIGEFHADQASSMTSWPASHGSKPFIPTKPGFVVKTARLNMF